MEASYQGGVSYEHTDHFQQLSQSIASNMKKIAENVSSMSKIVNQLQTPQDSQELRNQLREIHNCSQKLAKHTSMMIMDLMKTPTDVAANKFMRDRLRDEYMTTLNAFQEVQKRTAQKTKEDVRKAKAQSVNFGDPFALSDRSESTELGLSRAVQHQLAAQSETELLQLEERERDIRRLENDIMDVNSIFKELGILIHEQGTVLNYSIESSVECATHTVEAATRELSTAATYKNKLRKRKIYLAAVILIIIIAIKYPYYSVLALGSLRSCADLDAPLNIINPEV